jgi:TPR repeat protein
VRGLRSVSRSLSENKLSVDQGNNIGQVNLGVFYEYGRGGLTRDVREAARLYKLSADQGNEAASRALGRLQQSK